MSISPVTLLTGLPGNGKTLYALTIVKQRAEKENRQVYYHGIEILDKEALPWIEIEPEQWHTLPAGAIIVFDEAHKIFPVRPTGSKVPDHVLPIAELRHEGFNMYLITQHPMEIDSSVRRRVGQHFHLVRRFGMERSAVYEWDKVKPNCDQSKKDAILHEWSFNTKAYSWYKSAEIHTIKRKLPARLLWIVAAVVLLPFAIWFVWHTLVKKTQDSAAASAAPSVSASAPVGQKVAGRVGDDYFGALRPRVPGLPHTAPVYDEVTRPVRAPYPAACVESETRCQCYTQQGTRLDTTIEICHGIATGGYFVAWDEKQPGQQPPPARAPAHVVEAQPVGTGLGGFNTSRVASADPVSALYPSATDSGGVRSKTR